VQLFLPQVAFLKEGKHEASFSVRSCVLYLFDLWTPQSLRIRIKFCVGFILKE